MCTHCRLEDLSDAFHLYIRVLLYNFCLFGRLVQPGLSRPWANPEVPRSVELQRSDTRRSFLRRRKEAGRFATDLLASLYAILLLRTSMSSAPIKARADSHEDSRARPAGVGKGGTGGVTDPECRIRSFCRRITVRIRFLRLHEVHGCAITIWSIRPFRRFIASLLYVRYHASINP